MAGLSGGGGGGAVRAGKAFVELFAQDNQVYRALDRLNRRFRSLGNFMVKIGGIAGGVGASVLAAFKPAIDALGDQAKIADAADAFGLTASAASRLFGIMAAGGSDIRDATEGLVTLNQRVADAIAGAGEEPVKLFKDLGVEASRFQRLDSAERFYALFDALRAVADPAERVRLLLKAVGEDTGKNLIPLLSMSADEMRDLGGAFESSAEDLKSAREATRSYTMAMAQVGKVWRDVATAIAPVIKQAAEQVSAFAGPVSEVVGKNRELVSGLLIGAAALAAVGAGLIAAGGSLSGFAAAGAAALVVFKLLFGAAAALVSPLGLVAAAIAGLGYLFLTQTEAGQELVKWISGGLLGALDTLAQAWGGIVAALQKGDLALAGQIAAKGLQVVWLDLVDTLKSLWAGLKFTFTDTWAKALLGAKLAVNDFGNFVDKVFISLRATVDDVFRSVVVAALDAAISVATALDSLDPTDRLKGAIDAAKQLRAAVAGGGMDADALKGFRDAERDDRAKKLMEAEKAAEEARLKGVAEDVMKANERLAKAKAELADLVAKANQPLPGKLPDGARPSPEAVKKAAELADSRGTFNAAAIGQRFGADSLTKKQLKAAEDTAQNTGRTTEKLQAIAELLTLK